MHTWFMILDDFGKYCDVNLLYVIFSKWTRTWKSTAMALTFDWHTLTHPTALSKRCQSLHLVGGPVMSISRATHTQLKQLAKLNLWHKWWQWRQIKFIWLFEDVSIGQWANATVSCVRMTTSPGHLFSPTAALTLCLWQSDRELTKARIKKTQEYHFLTCFCVTGFFKFCDTLILYKHNVFKWWLKLVCASV